MASENPGVAPLDKTTPTGQVRLNTGDTEYVRLEAPIAGLSSFAYFSDDTIEAFLLAGRGSVTRATGLAYRQMAAGAALVGALNKTHDEVNDNRQRASDLMALSQSWLSMANDEDAIASDFIYATPTSTRHSKGMSWA